MSQTAPPGGAAESVVVNTPLHGYSGSHGGTETDTDEHRAPQTLKIFKDGADAPTANSDQGARESPGDASHLAAPAPIRSAEGLFRGPGCGVAGEMRGKLVKESEQFFSLNPRKQSKARGLPSKFGHVTVKVTHTLHLSMALGRDGTSRRDDGRVAPSLRAEKSLLQLPPRLLSATAVSERGFHVRSAECRLPAGRTAVRGRADGTRPHP